MRKHEGCTHGPGRSWIIRPERRWFARCDTCGTFRPWADYFEVYGATKNWWWECEQCLAATVITSAEQKAKRDACYCCSSECREDGCMCEELAGRVAKTPFTDDQCLTADDPFTVDWESAEDAIYDDL